MHTQSKLANALRSLSIDAIEKAKSGHPGAPLGMADIAAELWLNYMKFNPSNQNWFNRDRFILSNGHASALLYSALHLTGYDISIDDLKDFRQFASKTPGHPELGRTFGVEMTTGPLGQGLASALGFALAEKLLAHEFNKPNFKIVDHRTFVFVGDGCLMEGLSHEAVSLAGTLHLGKLIVLYDDNSISIDGNVKQWFADDTPARFLASGWQVVRDIDGHDPKSIQKALDFALNSSEDGQPILLCFKTIIGFGSPKKAGTASCHGSPLGAEEILATKANLGIDYPAFTIPQEIYAEWDRTEKGFLLEREWTALFDKYAEAYPESAKELVRRTENHASETNLHEIEKAVLQKLQAIDTPIATRVASQKALDALAPFYPELFGGSADLSGSVGTVHSGTKDINPSSTTTCDFSGNYLHYGVREFAMGCIMNGLALHGGFIPYGGTFLVFSDYARSAIRLAALMGQKVIWVLTHDSIGVGEDGPTHQPIEHVSSLRLIPDLNVWRPADATETAVAWLSAMQTDGPTALILSRQNLPQITGSASTEDIKRGGYILKDCLGIPEIILIATGSELDLALQAWEVLNSAHRSVRLVSMPCAEIFANQSSEYKNSILHPKCRNRIAIEAAASDFWYKYVGIEGRIVGMSTFGESAPAEHLFAFYGFSVENILDTIDD